MKALIIYNSYSGISSNKEIEYIKNKLSFKYNIIDSYKSNNDIKEYVICNSNQYDLLIIIGGDGTINQAVNGLMVLYNKPLLAYIPMGTCNDFGRSLGLKKSLDITIKNILNDNFRLINVNKINTDYYLYGMALGNMTNVSYNINPIFKRIFGKSSYYINVLNNIFKDNSFNINMIIDNKNIIEECYCLMALNTKYLASKKIRFNNDYIDNDNIKIVLIKKSKRIINIFNLILFFILGERYNHNIFYYEGKDIYIKIDKSMRINIDGECLPLLDNIYVSRIKDVIKIIINN